MTSAPGTQAEGGSDGGYCDGRLLPPKGRTHHHPIVQHESLVFDINRNHPSKNILWIFYPLMSEFSYRSGISLEFSIRFSVVKKREPR